MKLLIAAGGTGGHIFPGISVAEAFVREKGNEVVFTGTSHGLEERLIPLAGFRLVKIEAHAFSRTSPMAKVKSLVTLMKSIFLARYIIKSERPQAILGMGGFTVVPVMLAGLMTGVPCFIHEQNAYPGMANRLLSGWVKAAFVSFETSSQYLKAKNIIHTGNPVRKAIRDKKQGKPDDNFNIFVFGGSRGAMSINNAVIEMLPYLEAFRKTVIYHQTGVQDYERVKAAYAGASTVHEVFPFTDEMEKYYNLADVVVSRAGASTIFELAYFAKPSILVPYPYSAGNHQWKNASAVESLGGCHIISNDELAGDELYRVITELRENPEELALMGENIRALYVEESEEKVIRGIKASVS
jgi:UDP-N-acetylglucosamine--N-acetylmuramyl-(pentapeptide) pyrophosphoryl-undecaprenol N-acetylglucosamine transferase